jgi:hypothetical protein
MSNYSSTMAGSSAGAVSIGQMSQIDLGGYVIDGKKLPNKKISFDVHTAHGGYVVRVSHGYGNEDDMYVIGETQDLGQELGKIVTHHTLAKS